jgi:hypothetical protein
MTMSNKYCPHYSVLLQKWMQTDDLIKKVEAFKELWDHCNNCETCKEADSKNPNNALGFKYTNSTKSEN